MDDGFKRKFELIEKFKAKPGYAGKVAAKCIECIYDPNSGGGTWRQQTQACTVTGCPLWTVRPLSESNESNIAQENI